MKFSIHATLVVAAIFAAVCLSVAVTGFTSLRELTDPEQIADARGFAWFWTFLGCVAIATGVLGWWLARSHKEGEDS